VDFVKRAEARQLRALAELADCNPFVAKRVALEKAALGADYRDLGTTWHISLDPSVISPNLVALRERIPAFVALLRDRLSEGAQASAEQLAQYDALVRHHLYYQYDHEFAALIERSERGKLSTRSVSSYERYAQDVRSFLDIPGVELPQRSEPAHLFAWGFQINRAFVYIFQHLFGASPSMARLRASVWQSIFTHDPHRYRSSLFSQMGDIPTLIIGESGTGKEIVARAIGLSRYIAFDEESRRFSVDYTSTFYPVNLSALSPSLVESELFGHVKGAYTGAIRDHQGLFEVCGPLGTIFLDEIGDLDPAIQVKLLRVLQTREFQRVGENERRHFKGKIIAATHQDLGRRIESGEIRSDFYYRIAGDVVHTPSLREQLSEEPSDLERLTRPLAERIVGEAGTARLADEVLAWVRSHLGAGYAWPGNVRELEQCVRSILIRGSYQPPHMQRPQGGESTLLDLLQRLDLSADQLLRHYCTAHYMRSPNYREVARRLGIDRRTVKEKVDPALIPDPAGAERSEAKG
jgi:DNA-binding NtrC family response regulator